MNTSGIFNLEILPKSYAFVGNSVRVKDSIEFLPKSYTFSGKSVKVEDFKGLTPNEVVVPKLYVLGGDSA